MFHFATFEILALYVNTGIKTYSGSQFLKLWYI